MDIGADMKVEPYLFFNGRAEEAIEFYKRAVGAQVTMLLRYKEAPESPPPGMLPPGSENKVMHASFTVGESTVMASDGDCNGAAKMEGFSLSITAKSDAEAERVFNALLEGGKVRMPLGKTFFSTKFGMLTDKFGLEWMVNVV